jgi:hypothetical protein
MRVPRMTTRRWMIFVVVVGLLMGVIVGGVRLRHHRPDVAIRAIHHAMRKIECERLKVNAEQMVMFKSLRKKILGSERSPGSPDSPALDKAAMDKPKAAKLHWPDEVTRMERAIAYHAAMQRKYEDAAQRPWLPVAPDPPAPN